MSFLTQNGTLASVMPSLMGRIHWVAPGAGGYSLNGETFTAADGNDGVSPEHALATIDQAIANATASAGEVIMCLPGTHTPSASLALSKAGVKLLSLEAVLGGNLMRLSTTIAAVTGDQTANATAADVEIAGFNIIPVTADTAIDFTNAADGLHVHHCKFDMATPVASTGTKGLEALSGAEGVNFHHLYFDCDGAQGPAFDITACTDGLIENFIIGLSAGTWDVAVQCGAGTDGMTMRNGKFLAGAATITTGIDGTGVATASAVHCDRLNFADSVTQPLRNFSAGEAELVECYSAGVGAGDGGALITAIST